MTIVTSSANPVKLNPKFTFKSKVTFKPKTPPTATNQPTKSIITGDSNPCPDLDAVGRWEELLGSSIQAEYKLPGNGAFKPFGWRKELERLQSQGATVYQSVNPHDNGRSDGNVTQIRALVVDLDHKEGAPTALDGVRAAIAAANLPAPTIVQSKNGWHCWWFVAPGVINPEEYKSTVQKLAHALPGGDSKVVAPSNLIGLPGSLHVKDPANPFLVHVVQAEPTRYGQELLSVISVLPAPPKAKAKEQTKPDNIVPIGKPTSKSSDKAIAAYLCSSTTGKRERLNECAIAKGGQIAKGQTTHDATVEFLTNALKSSPDVSASVQDWTTVTQTIESGIQWVLERGRGTHTRENEEYPIHPKVADLLPRQSDGMPPQRIHKLKELDYKNRLLDGRLRFDIRREQVEFDGARTNSSTLALALLKEQREWGYIAPDTLDHALMLAKANPFDEFLEYVETLPVWTKEETDAFALVAVEKLRWPQDDQFYAYLMQFGVDMMRRLYHPGCVQRLVLTLLGGERVGKSSFFVNITKTGGWGATAESDFTVGGQSSANEFTEAARIRAAVLIVMDELDSVTRKADQAALKDNISRTHDFVREIGQKETQSRPRRCIIAATGNHKETLPPDDANTRFMMVDLAVQPDWEWLNNGGWRLLQTWFKNLYIHGRVEGQHVDSDKFNTYCLNDAQREEQVTRNRGYVLSTGQEELAARFVRTLENDPTWFNSETGTHLGLTLDDVFECFLGRNSVPRNDKTDLKRALQTVGYDLKQKWHEGANSKYITKNGFDVDPLTPKERATLKRAADSEG